MIGTFEMITPTYTNARAKRIHQYNDALIVFVNHARVQNEKKNTFQL